MPLLQDFLGLFNNGQSPYQTDEYGQVQGSGLLNSFGKGLQNNSDSLMQFGLGMLGGKDISEGFQNAAQGYARGSLLDRQRTIDLRNQMQAAARKKAAEEFAKSNPSLAPYAGLMTEDPEFAQKMAAEKFKTENRDPLDDALKRAQIASYEARAQGRDASFGMNGQIVTRINPETGKEEQAFVQLGSNGQLKVNPVPDGWNLANGVEKVDRGTHWDIIDKRTGEVLRQDPKDLAGAARDKASGAAVGGAVGQAAATLPAMEDSATQALRQIEEVRNHPGKARGTGGSSLLNAVPGTSGYDFRNRVQQLQAGAFLKAYESLRGTGAIANTEGEKATAAITRLNEATSEKEFDAALNDLENVIKVGIQKARNMAKGNLQPGGPRYDDAPASPPANGGGNRVRYDANGNRL